MIRLYDLFYVLSDFVIQSFDWIYSGSGASGSIEKLILLLYTKTLFPVRTVYIPEFISVYNSFTQNK